MLEAVSSSTPMTSTAEGTGITRSRCSVWAVVDSEHEGKKRKKKTHYDSPGEEMAKKLTE